MRSGFGKKPQFEVRLYHLLAVQILAGPLASQSLGFLIYQMVTISGDYVVVNFTPYHNLYDMLGTDPAT